MSNPKRNLYEKPDNKSDYIKTFLITISIVLTFGLLNIFYMVHNIFNGDVNSRKQNVDSAFEAYLVDVLVDKNKDIEKRFPKNYVVNLRLGLLYSYKKDYLNAEHEFKNSIEKADSCDYTPNYQLAKLYIKTNRLQEAQSVMDVINDRADKRLLKYKGDVYMFLGDTYYDQGYYALSVMKLEKSITYFNAIKDKSLKNAKNKYIKALVSLADKYVETGKIDEAVMALENAYEIKPKDVVINYKLGLLYVDNNPEKAYDLLSFVNKKEPQIMNYDAYFDLLNKLSDIELQKGNETDGELYRKKALQYKKFVKDNLLSNKDLFIDVQKTDIITDIAAQDYVVTLKFNLQNNSGLNIDNLTIHAIFKDNNNVIQNFNQKIYDDTKIFKAGEVSPPIVVCASEPYKNNQNGNIDVEVYAYKYPKYRIKLYSTSIPKPPVK